MVNLKNLAAKCPAISIISARNTIIALFIIIALTSAFAAPAITKPTIAPKPAVTTTTAESPTTAEPSTATSTPNSPVTTSTTNLPVTTSTQAPSTATGEGIDQNPEFSFDLLPQNLSVTVGDTLVVTVAVENVTDMYAWQVCMCFDSTVLQCTGVSLPSNNAFSNSVTTSAFLNDYNATEFPRCPLQRVTNDEGWVLAFDCLLGANQTTFNGSGVLCQMEFKAVSPGSTVLKLPDDSAPFSTWLMTPGMTTIASESACCSYVYVASN